MGTCAYVSCLKSTVGNSKYCAEHRTAAFEHMRGLFAEQKAAKLERDSQFNVLYNTADEAGKNAVDAAKVTPMIVGTPTTLFGNDIDYSQPTYYVSDGVCGFAWITIKPANSAFANWLKARGLASKAYGGGVSIWVHDYNQSMQKKETYAHAFAKVLRDAGINAYAGSRMD